MPIPYPYNIVTNMANYPEFVTHSNYLEFVKNLSVGLELSVNIAVPTATSRSRDLERKLTLARLTKRNLDEEQRNVEEIPDYSVVCVSWIPVKAYYLCFNLLLILEYLLTGEGSSFALSHTALHRRLKEHFTNGDISFNKHEFNAVHQARVIVGWRFAQGANLRRRDRNIGVRCNQIIKKLFTYAKDTYKQRKGVQSLRGNRKDRFLDRTAINLCEFFYWYRIKANYRDMEFVESGVPVSQFLDFYNNYYELSMNFYKAVAEAINGIAGTVFGEEILLT